MQVQEIRLTNFKCFKDVKVQCSKFTLLTGANSSGKSSILHGLLGAIQTKDFPLYFSPNGTYVSMGDFEELAYDHSPRIKFGIGFSLIAEKGARYGFDCKYYRNPKTKLPKLHDLDYRAPAFSFQVATGADGYTARFAHDPEKEFGFSASSQQGFRNAMRGLFEATQTAARDAGKKVGKHLTPEKMMQMIFPTKGRKGRFRFKDAAGLHAAVHKRGLLSPFSTMTTVLSMFEQQFGFISSFRLPPERTYYQKTKAALKVDKYGDNAIDQILEWEHAKSPASSSLASALERLQLAKELRSQRYSGGRFDIRVVPPHSVLPSSLCDVGFGVSQFLPVLVADLQMGKGSTLAVSQPEIHLHPSVQANLANYFSEQSAKMQKRYILETHSEYLINRFRLLVVKGELKEEDVAVYYLGPGTARPTCHTVRFRRNGQIEGAPEDFFSTYMMDAKDIAMSA